MSISALASEGKGVAVLALTVALVMIILGQFASTSGVTTSANTSINTFITALGTYATWGGIIVLIGVASYMFMKMKKAF